MRSRAAGPFLALLLCSSSAWAQSARQFDFTQNMVLKTVPRSFGGAYRALADSNAAILYNPAGMAQLRGKVAAGGDYAHDGSLGADAFSVAIVDFKAIEALALGVQYDYDKFSYGDTVTVQQVAVAAATEFGSVFSVGGAVKGYWSVVDSPFVNGPDGADLDLGILFKPIPLLSIAVTASNLILGQRTEEFPFQMGFGAALLLEPHVRLAVDLLYDFKSAAAERLNAYFGGQFRAAEGFFLRAGFGLDRVRANNFYSVGAAVSGPKIGLNFAFSQRLSPTDETYAANVELYF